MHGDAESRRIAGRLLPPFWVLVEEHGAELLAYARRLVGQDAEDVLQEALLRALRSYPKLAHADHLRAWLYRITTTTAFDHHSRREKRREVLSAQVDGPAQQLSDGRESFEALIGGLPRGARSALDLRYMQDLSYEDMARRLGCSPEAARQRVSAAVRTLRRRLT